MVIKPSTPTLPKSCPAGVDWRHKLETQRGAVLATELKNNANKLAKWTAAALVSGVEIIKLGYVSRVHQRDTRHHVILGTQVRPTPFPSPNSPPYAAYSGPNILAGQAKG